MARIALIALALAACVAISVAYPHPQQVPADEGPMEDGPMYEEEQDGQAADPQSRVERDSVYASPKGYGHSGGGYPAVGPVRTFVKTDYHGNFKWGVRHVAGKGGYH